MPSLGDGLNDQRVAVDVAIVGQHVDGHRIVLAGGHTVIICHRVVVDTGHRDVHHRTVKASVAVAGDVGEAVAAAVVGLGRVGDVSAIVGHGAVRTLGDRVDDQGIAVDVTVVGQYVNGHRIVLIGACTIIIGHRVVVEADHVDGHGGRVGTAIAIAGDIGEAVAAAVIGIGLVSERAIGDQRQRTVGRVALPSRRQPITIRVSIVGQNPRCRDGEQAVFAGCVGIVHGRGGGVEQGDRGRTKRTDGSRTIVQEGRIDNLGACGQPCVHPHLVGDGHLGADRYGATPQQAAILLIPGKRPGGGAGFILPAHLARQGVGDLGCGRASAAVDQGDGVSQYLAR